MKQNSQWLSQVCTRSNTAEDTSRPSASPSALATATRRASPSRSTSSTTSASSASHRYSSTSRGARPLRASTWSPVRTPAVAAGEPGVTATTSGGGTADQATADRSADPRWPLPTHHPRVAGSPAPVG